MRTASGLGHREHRATSDRLAQQVSSRAMTAAALAFPFGVTGSWIVQGAASPCA